jgi:hypothetical protein
MAEAEHQKAVDSESWYRPVDAIFENIQAKLPGDWRLRRDWSDYLKHIRQTWSRWDPFARDALDADVRVAKRWYSAEPNRWSPRTGSGRRSGGLIPPPRTRKSSNGGSPRRSVNTSSSSSNAGSRTRCGRSFEKVAGRARTLRDRSQTRCGQFPSSGSIGATPRPALAKKGRCSMASGCVPRRIEEVPLDQVLVEQSAELGEISEAQRSTDPDKKPTIEGALTDDATPRHTAGARDPRRGPLPGRTNWVVQAYEKLLPTLRGGRLSGEAYRRAIRRLLREDQLPGTGDPENRIDELARYWAETDRRDGLT